MVQFPWRVRARWRFPRQRYYCPLRFIFVMRCSKAKLHSACNTSVSCLLGIVCWRCTFVWRVGRWLYVAGRLFSRLLRAGCRSVVGQKPPPQIFRFFNYLRPALHGRKVCGARYLFTMQFAARESMFMNLFRTAGLFQFIGVRYHFDVGLYAEL